jgi:hypothetical protein
MMVKQRISGSKVSRILNFGFLVDLPQKEMPQYALDLRLGR